MFLTVSVNEATRRLKFLDSSAVVVVSGDNEINGIIFQLPASYYGGFDFSTATWRVNYVDTAGNNHTVLITNTDESTGYPFWQFDDVINKGAKGTVKFAFIVSEVDPETALVSEKWNSLPANFDVRQTVSGSNSDEEAVEEDTYDRLASAIAAVRSAQAGVEDVNAVLSSLTGSSPVVAATVAALANIDTSEHQIAIVQADGYLYYYDGSAWQQGFEYGSCELDDTLSVAGKAADAAAVGEEIAEVKGDLNALDGEAVKTVNGTAPDANGNVQVEAGSGSGLTDDVKTALLACFDGVAWKNAADAVTRYNNLYDALYAVTAISLSTNSISLASIGATSQLTATTTPAGGTVAWTSSDDTVATVSSSGLVTSIGYGTCTITATAGSVSATCAVTVAQATLTSISAVYTQGGTVYTTDSLDDLKSDLVVTATYSDSTTATVASADYTLSGTLTEGTSTITVTYGGQTATFNVTVSASPYLYVLHDSDFMKKTCVTTSYPYYTSNNSRILYAAFDLLLTGGKSYRFAASTTYDNSAQMGLQFFTQGVLNAVNEQNGFGQGAIYDPGWQNLDTTVEVPEFYPTNTQYESNRIRGVRIVFRQNSSNSTISDDFLINSFTIEEVEAS